MIYRLSYLHFALEIQEPCFQDFLRCGPSWVDIYTIDIAGSEAEAEENAQRELEPTKTPTAPQRDSDGPKEEASGSRADAAKLAPAK